MQQFNHDNPSQTYTYTVSFQPHNVAPEAQHSQSQEYSQPDQQQAYQQGYGQPYQQPVPPYEGASASYTMPQPPPFSYVVPPIQVNVFPPAYTRPENGKFLAAISYLGFWLTGFLLILFVRENRFVRFHAMQSLLLFGGVNVAYILFGSSAVMLRHFHPGPLIIPIVLAFVLVNIFAVVAWFVGFFSALSGKYFKLPFVGDMAERYANGRTQVK